MQVKKLNSSTIRKTESRIRTGGQKVITAEQKIRSDLTTSTMGEEEEEKNPDKKKAQNKRTENPVLEFAKDMLGRTTQLDARETYQNKDTATVRKETAEKEKKEYIERMDVKKALERGGRYRTNQKKRVPSGGQRDFVSQTRKNPQKAAYQTESVIRQKGKEQVTKETAKSFAKETAKGFSKEAVKAGGTAAAGAATAGVAVGVVAAEKSAKIHANKIKRAKAKLLASMEAEHQQKKDSARQQERRRNTSLQEEQTKQEEKSFSSSVMLLLPVVLPMILLMLVFAAVFGSMVPNQPEEDNTRNGLKIVAIAKHEETLSKENIGGNKYKSWYGMNDNWCAMFVSWCADQCGYIDSGIMPRTASVAAMKKWYIERNLFQPADSGYEPKPGDIIIFGNGKSHTGIVIEYDSNRKQLVTIEGNTGKSSTDPYHKGSSVRKKTYSLKDGYIAGYGTPEYPSEEDTEETEEGGF